MKNQQFKHQLKLTDKYGNNIDFPDEILSDMTLKGLLGKWTKMILSKITSSLIHYYAPNKNNYCVNDIKCFFQDTAAFINSLTPVLEDMVHKNIYGIEDIFIAVYGVMSDEVYALRRFNYLLNRINDWDEDYMWQCCPDERLHNYIVH